MKKLLSASLLATTVLLTSQAQANTFSTTVNGSFSESFFVTVATDPGTIDNALWFRFRVTALASDFMPFSYAISESGSPTPMFSGSINPTGLLYNWTFFDKADSVQDFSSAHTYNLTISGQTKSAGDKAFVLATNSFIASVPEPESYAMLLAGLGLLGFMARRKQTAI